MLKKITHEENGQSMVLFALLIIVLIGFAGLAIDGGRLYIAKSELQKAVDAGALAGADTLIDDYLIPNKNFDSTEDEKVKGVVRGIAINNYNTATYTPIADYVINRTENYYRVEGKEKVNLLLMPVLGIKNTTEVNALARVKIVRETTPGLNPGNIIPIGIKSVPTKGTCEICELVFDPGTGTTGNYNFLNFSIIEPPEKILSDKDCNSGKSDIDGYITTGPPQSKPISVDWHTCSKPGQSDKQIAEAINTRITEGKGKVYVPIVSGYGTGTNPTTVIGFAEVELQPIPDKSKNWEIYGKFIKIVQPDDFKPISNFTTKLDL